MIKTSGQCGGASKEALQPCLTSHQDQSSQPKPSKVRLSTQPQSTVGSLMTELPPHASAPFIRDQGIVKVPPHGEKQLYDVSSPRIQPAVNGNYCAVSQSLRHKTISSVTTPTMPSSLAACNESVDVSSSDTAFTRGGMTRLSDMPMPEPGIMLDRALPKPSPSHYDLQCMEDMIPFTPTPPALLEMTTASSIEFDAKATEGNNDKNSSISSLSSMNATMSAPLPTDVSNRTALLATRTGEMNSTNDWKPKNLTQQEIIEEQKEIQERIQNQMQQDQQFQQQRFSAILLPLVGSTAAKPTKTIVPNSMLAVDLPNESSLQSVQSKSFQVSKVHHRDSKIPVQKDASSSDVKIPSSPLKTTEEDESILLLPSYTTTQLPMRYQHSTILHENVSKAGSNLIHESSHDNNLISSPLTSEIMWSKEPARINEMNQCAQDVKKKVNISRSPEEVFASSHAVPRNIGKSTENYEISEYPSDQKVSSQPQFINPKFHPEKQSESSRSKGRQGTMMPTAEMISRSIPSNASAVFHIFDRRVNLDSHKADASFYSLLRSWVQDDPYRCSFHCGARLLDHMSIPIIKRGEERHVTKEEKHKKLNKLDRAEILLLLQTRESNTPKPDTKRLLSDHVNRAKRRKIEFQLEVKQKMKRSRKRLKDIGIVV